MSRALRHCGLLHDEQLDTRLRSRLSSRDNRSPEVSSDRPSFLRCSAQQCRFAEGCIYAVLSIELITLQLAHEEALQLWNFKRLEKLLDVG